MNYYNEIDPFCAAWLRNLIDAELIPTGDVDERSIKDVTADDLEGYTQCHFFAGIGGWPLALQIAGWPDDLAVWTGSCPCQPFSQAGKRKGTADSRHLWPEFYRLIAECGPAIVFGEQVSGKDGLQWLDGVFADLEGIDYACGAADLPAACVGAPHRRHRLFWVADAGGSELGRRDESAGQHGRALHVADGSEPIRLADAEHSESRIGEQAVEGRARLGRDRFAIDGDSGELADTDVVELRGLSPAGKRSINESNGRMGHADNARLQGRASESGDDGPQQPTAQRACGLWADSRIIPCRDNKARRISSQRGDEPLAYWIPVSMGSGRTKPERMAIRAARANRTGRLRGYGNAIVPEVAAEFIRSVAAHNESEA